MLKSLSTRIFKCSSSVLSTISKGFLLRQLLDACNWQLESLKLERRHSLPAASLLAPTSLTDSLPGEFVTASVPWTWSVTSVPSRENPTCRFTRDIREVTNKHALPNAWRVQESRVDESYPRRCFTRPSFSDSAPLCGEYDRRPLCSYRN